jgi:hypothetical protein
MFHKLLAKFKRAPIVQADDNPVHAPTASARRDDIVICLPRGELAETKRIEAAQASFYSTLDTEEGRERRQALTEEGWRQGDWHSRRSY